MTLKCYKNGVVAAYECNSQGKVLKSTTEGDHVGTKFKITTSAVYDMLGNMLTSTDGRGNTTEYTYEGLNWLKSVKAPFDNTGKSEVYYEYDNLGNKTRERVKTTAGSYRATEYTYDARNRVTKVKTDATTTEYTYDKAGNITGVKQSAPSGESRSIRYAYNSRNLVTKYTDAMGQSETYTYDSLGQLTRVDSQRKRTGTATP